MNIHRDRLISAFSLSAFPLEAGSEDRNKDCRAIVSFLFEILKSVSITSVLGSLCAWRERQSQKRGAPTWGTSLGIQVALTGGWYRHLINVKWADRPSSRGLPFMNGIDANSDDQPKAVRVDEERAQGLGWRPGQARASPGLSLASTCG